MSSIICNYLFIKYSLPMNVNNTKLSHGFDILMGGSPSKPQWSTGGKTENGPGFGAGEAANGGGFGVYGATGTGVGGAVGTGEDYKVTFKVGYETELG